LLLRLTALGDEQPLHFRAPRLSIDAARPQPLSTFRPPRIPGLVHDGGIHEVQPDSDLGDPVVLKRLRLGVVAFDASSD
jgi:hypothetical protein